MPARHGGLRPAAHAAALMLAIAGAVMAAADPPAWRPIGPWGGPAALWSDRGSQRLWAGTCAGYLHESLDGGRSWRWLGPACGARGPCSLLPSPHDDRLWFAFGLAGEVWRSHDGRNSWQPLELVPGTPVTTRAVASVAFDHLDPALFYLLGRDGRLWHSADAGETFSHALTLDAATREGSYLVAVPEVSRSVLVVTTNLHLCHLTSAHCVALFAEPPQHRLQVAAFGDGGGVWVAMGRTILFAPAAGATWQDASGGMEAVVSGYPEPVVSFAFNASERAAYALTTAGMLRRDLDRGGPWRFVVQEQEAMAAPDNAPCGWLLQDGGHLIACSPRGPLFCREDGTACEARNHGLAGLRTRATTLDQETGEVQTAATVAGVYTRAPAHDTWTRVLDYFSPFGAALAHLSPRGPEVLLASSWSLQRSHDGGRSWSPLPLAISHIEHFPPSVAVPGREGRSLLVAASGELWRSSDSGESWTKLPQPIEMLAVNPRSPEEVWAGYQGRLQRSLDAGATWQGGGEAMCPPMWCWDNVITAMAVNPFATSHILYGTAGRGLWSHHPQEGTKQLNTGLPLIAAVAFDPDRPGRILVAGGRFWGDVQGGQGLVSEDAGATWTRLGGDLPLPDPRDMAVSFRHGRVAVATDAGIFVLEDSPRDNRPLRRAGPGRR